MSDHVIILHGLGRGRRSLRRLERALRAAGYQTHCPDYPSRNAVIEQLVDRLAPSLPHAGRVHMIGHSLGGILALRLMERMPQPRRGRIVQLGAPNLGSALARRSAPVGWLLGPALQELEHPQPAPAANLQIGAIAGTAALPIYSLITGIEGPNDGKVSRASAHGHAQHTLTLPLAHATMMNAPEAIAASLRFLASGHF